MGLRAGGKAKTMVHDEYDKMRTTLATGLRSVGLDRVTEIDGPNRLGGFRVGDGENSVALSLVPPRKKDDRDAGRHWWVSAWMPVADGFDSLLSPDLITVSHRREVMIKKPLACEDAVISAIQLLAELRVRAALNRVRIAEVAPSRPDKPATSPNVFRTAPNRPAEVERELVESGN